jgi:hypothetical protein
MAAAKSAEVYFNSSCDFTILSMNIIGEQDINPEFINLNITLQPVASQRLAQVSRDHMNQSLTLYINGVKIGTSIVRAELNSGHLQVAVEKYTARKIFPGLLNTQCTQGRRASESPTRSPG